MNNNDKRIWKVKGLNLLRVHSYVGSTMDFVVIRSFNYKSIHPILYINTLGEWISLYLCTIFLIARKVRFNDLVKCINIEDV